jgi:hypothetical protein
MHLPMCIHCHDDVDVKFFGAYRVVHGEIEALSTPQGGSAAAQYATPSASFAL